MTAFHPSLVGPSHDRTYFSFFSVFSTISFLFFVFFFFLDLFLFLFFYFLRLPFNNHNSNQTIDGAVVVDGGMRLQISMPSISDVLPDVHPDGFKRKGRISSGNRPGIDLLLLLLFFCLDMNRSS
jgi:hypothetical protein